MLSVRKNDQTTIPFLPLENNENLPKVSFAEPMYHDSDDIKTSTTNKVPSARLKLIGIVKPVHSGAEKQPIKNNRLVVNNSTASRLKRRSIGILNGRAATNNASRQPTAPSASSNMPPRPTVGRTVVSNNAYAARGTTKRPAPAEPVVQLRRSARVSQNTSRSSASTLKMATAVPAKKSRPGWDLKGRMADMEDMMRSQQQQNDALRAMFEQTQKKNVILESTAQEKTAVLEEDRAKLAELQQKLRAKANELDRAELKIADLEYANRSLKASLHTSQLQVDELSTNVARMSSAMLSVNIELDTVKTENLKIQQVRDSLLNERISMLKERDLLRETGKENEEKLRSAEMSRRKLHNMVQELKGNIRVYCRVRPYLPAEMKSKQPIEPNIWPPHVKFCGDEGTSIEINKDKCELADSSTLSVTSNKREIKHVFNFDRVFNPGHSQKHIFEEISQLIQSAIDGYNVCIFAYGQTGSGKTYTMQGSENENLDSAHSEHAGMIPLSVRQIFQTAKELESHGWRYHFEASYLEIYNERVRDLLTEQPNEEQNLDLKLVSAPSLSLMPGGPAGQKAAATPAAEINIPGLTVASVENESQVHELIKLAIKKRASAATKCNDRSSRSHAVFRLRIRGSNLVTGVSCDGTLVLVDLAGSECLKESEATGDRLRETQNINKSLSTLGQVIMALSQKDAHVPYRNSKLTYLLQTYLGGNSKTLMFVNISPLEESVGQSINSLRFASKVNQCHIGAAFKK